MASQFRLSSLKISVISALILVITSTNAFADEYNSSLYKDDFESTPRGMQLKTLKDGLYGGIGLGYDSYQIHANMKAPVNGDTITANPSINSNGVVGSILGGYGQYFQKSYYLGGEALVNFSGASSNSTFNDADAGAYYRAQYQVNTSFAFSVLPGYKLNPSSLLYARVGLAYVDIRNQEYASEDGMAVSSNYKTWIHGLILGIGIETAVYEALSVRGEYSYTSYNSSGYSSFGTSYTPVDSQFMMSLIYHII